MLHNSLSRAAKKNMFQSCAPVRWHDHEIGRNCLRQPTNFIEWRCATKHIASRRGDSAFTCHSFELVECALFCILLVWHKRERDDRRSRRHTVQSVIELRSMREV